MRACPRFYLALVKEQLCKIVPLQSTQALFSNIVILDLVVVILDLADSLHLWV